MRPQTKEKLKETLKVFVIAYIFGFIISFSFFSYEFRGFTTFFESIYLMADLVIRNDFSLEINAYKNSLLFAFIISVYCHMTYLKIQDMRKEK